MSRVTTSVLAICALLFFSALSEAQQAGAPIYHDGDWWRVKVEVVRPTGVSVQGPQFGEFPEYTVKFYSAKWTVMGVRGDETRELESRPIIALVLGRAGWRGELLRFPMQVGLQWSDRFQVQPAGLPLRWVEGKYEVHGWEKAKTVKGEFEAFRILMTTSIPTGPKTKGSAVRTHTYYYAPAVKAIVSFEESGTEARVTSSLVEFKVSQ